MTGRLSNHVALATTEKSDPTPKIVPPQMLVYDHKVVLKRSSLSKVEGCDRN